MFYSFKQEADKPEQKVSQISEESWGDVFKHYVWIVKASFVSL